MGLVEEGRVEGISDRKVHLCVTAMKIKGQGSRIVHVCVCACMMCVLPGFPVSQ